MGKLASLRVAVGLSQQKVAGLLGIHQTLISFWERNQSALPVAKIPEIAKLYGVPEYVVMEANLADMSKGVKKSEKSSGNTAVDGATLYPCRSPAICLREL